MNQPPPSFLNRFAPKGKLSQTPPGSSILCPLNSGTRLIINFVSLGPSKFDNKLDLMLTKVWGNVRQNYFAWSSDLQKFKLGNIKELLVNSDIMIVSLLVKDKEGIIQSEALEKALQTLAVFAKTEKGSVHISGLLIDQVPALKELAKKYLSETGIHCYFYDAPVEK